MKRISQIAAALLLLALAGCAVPGVDNHHGIFSAPDKNLETGAYEDRH